SISGRCLLSNYLAGRDSNLGACAQPCRWEYALMEKTREGEYFPVMEGEEGTYIFNSRDLCMIEYLPELMEAGVGSLKIEGRMKTPLYAAMVTKAYRQALDDLKISKKLYYNHMDDYKKALAMASHREYTTGFYLGEPGPDAQIYTSAQYVREADFIAVLKGSDEGTLSLEQRGKFSPGETAYLVIPGREPVPFTVGVLRDEEGNVLASANRAQQQVTAEAIGLSAELLDKAPSGCILIKDKPHE
ncbi:MAG: U32 family peptidase C-terminal domain-containing protein, partial [Lachnospiraceae bacterium]|nr:U32 family peptidase C-terminal domain-containing protein [Lachnospiraceae bacterium]